jgi:hypothetical protein
MRGSAIAVLLALVTAGGVGCSRPERYQHVPVRLPPPPAADAPGLPPLPASSPRNASYTIEARLDPEKHTISGSLVLDWRNTADRELASFPFHLYWNAFRNSLSTTARGEGRRQRFDATREQRRFGWIEVKSIRRIDGAEEDLTATQRFLSEDGNRDDRTVMEVRSARPVAPGATARFRVDWEALEPYGDPGRAGWVHDYHFVAQWFPKIGVFWHGAWNAHPFYPTTEFFSDFGVYDVKLTLPRGFIVGATGRLLSTADNPDGTASFRFVQEDVHDFAWTASRRFLERRGRFEDPGYPPVEIRLLLQPEHAHLAARYVESTKIALRAYGTWAAPYPYPQVTVVDPAWGSASGGMEYPTLFTGGAKVLSPPALHSPESVTIHECGHQFWYGLVANNEAEEAWLDEGLDSYMDARAIDDELGQPAWSRRLFGDTWTESVRLGWPLVAPSVRIPRGGSDRASLRQAGEEDRMAKPGWTYRDPASYVLNSYGKPSLVLQTLEGLLGEESMDRVLRVYARRFRFAHPTTGDFMATVDEVTGHDWGWFFEQTFFSSDLCDYAVSVDQQPARVPAGWFEGRDGRLEYRPPSQPKQGARDGAVDSRVTLIRRGEVRMPVELLLRFADGRLVRETWDGRDRWKRFEYPQARVVRAVVDPGRKIAIDVDPVNNEWIESDGPARRAATKWAARFLLWLQGFLEMQTMVG